MTPPRLFRELLRRVLPPEDRETFPGEIEELFVRRARREGRRRAGRWYVGQVLQLAVRRGLGAVRTAIRNGIDTWTEGGMMEALRRDVVYAVRRMVRTPGFTLVAVFSLALGIGANTAIFSLVNAVILRKTPWEHPEELVDLYTRVAGYSHASLSYPDYKDVRAEMRGVFTDVAASGPTVLPTEGDDGVAQMALAELVTGNYFTLLGIHAAVGRTILEEDQGEEDARPVVVLGYGYWERRFAGDAGVVGRQIRVGGVALTVVGVVEKGYQGALRGVVPDLYVPVLMKGQVEGSAAGLSNRRAAGFFTRARLKPGTTVADARNALQRMDAWLRETYPNVWQDDEALVLVPTADVVVNPMVDRMLVPALGLLLALVGVVLLIACANLASFLLARGSDRRREVAVRLALGARRLSLVRQLLTETMMLATLGAVVGVGLAVLLLRWLGSADLPLPIPVTLDLSLDARVLSYTALVALVAGVLFGLAPALQTTRSDVTPALKTDATGTGPGRFNFRNVLVVAQVAASVTLLVVAGLLIRGVQARTSVDPGFGYRPAAEAQVALGTDVPGSEVASRAEELLRRIQALPGVGTVTLATNVPLNALGANTRSVTVDGVAPPPDRDFWSIDFANVTPGYFNALGMRVLSGRALAPSDDASSAPVVVVNDAFAKLFFPDGDALGRTVRLGQGDEPTVVGVVNTVKVRSLAEAPRPVIYGAFRQRPYRSFWIIATSRGADPLALALRITRAGQEVDPELRVYDQSTVGRRLEIALMPARLSALLTAAFAALALVLAGIGLYGVVSYAVARRAREVGIRMSLGANAAQVVGMIMWDGLVLVGIGGLLGLALSAGVAQVLGRFLFGVDTLDPAAFGGTVLVLGAAALLASWVPARRATRVDPVRALKAE